jgi:hypothetical protein
VAELQELKDWVAECLTVRAHAASVNDFESIEETADMMLSFERLIAPPGSDINRTYAKSFKIST